MILAIDCGNSRLKWGLRTGGLHTEGASSDAWLAQGIVEYVDIASLVDLLRAQPRAQRAVVANVAGEKIMALVRDTLALLEIPAMWVQSQVEQCGVKNFYETPTQLGADRWAALIGARQQHSAACLVVCCGTATTMDVLDADGNFQGGLILPGVDLMLQALAHNTAQLPYADGKFTGLPRNTADAIVSGCLHAQVGAVERMYAQVADLPEALCIVSGGGADKVFDLLRMPKRHIASLVLIGLVQIGQ